MVEEDAEKDPTTKGGWSEGVLVYGFLYRKRKLMVIIQTQIPGCYGVTEHSPAFDLTNAYLSFIRILSVNRLSGVLISGRCYVEFFLGESLHFTIRRLSSLSKFERFEREN